MVKHQDQPLTILGAFSYLLRCIQLTMVINLLYYYIKSKCYIKKINKVYCLIKIKITIVIIEIIIFL